MGLRPCNNVDEVGLFSFEQLLDGFVGTLYTKLLRERFGLARGRISDGRDFGADNSLPSRDMKLREVPGSDEDTPAVSSRPHTCFASVQVRNNENICKY
jgi:hypothetical protein